MLSQLFPQNLRSILFGEHFNRPPDLALQAATLVGQTHRQKPKWLTAVECTTLAFLVLSVVASAILRLVFIHRTRQNGTIKLDPSSSEQVQVLTRKEALSDTLLEKMDHGLGDDGEAMNATAFWRSVRFKKALVAAIVATIYFDASVLDISRFAIETAACSYLLLLLPFYAFVSTDRAHRQLTHHLFWVSMFLVLHNYLVLSGPALAIGYNATPHWTAQYALGLSVALAIACGTISLGPGRYRERSRLYNKAISDKLREAGELVEPNVTGADGSILGNFLSFPTTTMMRRVVAVDQVDLDELPVLPASMQQQPSILESVQWGANFRKTWLGPTGSLILEVWGPQWLAWLTYMFCLGIEMIASYIPHLCVQQILSILDSKGDRSNAWAFAALWCLSQQVENASYAVRTWDINFFHVDRRMRAHLSYLLYRKLLTRSTYSMTDEGVHGKETAAHSKADVMNLISMDVFKLKDLLLTVSKAARFSMKMGLGFFYIWTILGPSGIWGIALSMAIYPPTYLLSRWQYRIFKTKVALQDKRVSLVQEAIQTISMIKMTASEAFWYNRLDSFRQQEFWLQLKARLVSSVTGLLYALAPVMVLSVSFGHYTLIREEKLTASIAFTAIAVFDEFRHSLISIPQLLTDLLQQYVSVKRVSAFLQNPDVEYLSESEATQDIALEDEPLVVQGDIAWAAHHATPTGETEPFVLRNLDIAFQRGSVTLIAGKFGSGKSLLLHAMLGEVALLRGRITYAISPIADPWQTEQAVDWTHSLEGLAFVPQTAWLQSMSIRENILFGLPMNVDRYRKVLYACALLPDLEVLEDGDVTEIGERGKILSGGQKARVGLARAVYSRASTVLLDDVISAVDAHTSQHIIKYCFKSSLMAGRTVIIASHAVEALAGFADRALFLEDGTVSWQGTGSELLETGYMSHLKGEKSAASSKASESGAESDGPEPEPSSKRKASLANEDEADQFEVRRAPAKTPRQILVEEKRDKGTVAAHHWIELMKMNGGPVYFSALGVFTVLSVMVPVLGRQFMKLWTSDEASSIASPVQWVMADAGLSVVFVVCMNLRYFLGFFGGFTAMKKNYAIVQDRVLRARMQFFTKTRAGSIVQRLGVDLDMVPQCSQLMGSAIEAVLSFAVSLTSVSYYVGWTFPLGVALLLAIYSPGINWYRISSRQVRRLMSILPGPVNALYGETVAGAAVIRAFGMQSVFVQTLIKTTNMHQTCYVHALAIGRWSNIWTTVFYSIVVTSAIALVIRSPGMTGGQAGFIIGFAQSITAEIGWMVRNLRDFDLDGVTLERLAEYRDLDTEDIAPLNGDRSIEPGSAYTDQDLSHWPSDGAIEVSGLGARYAPDMPEILHDVSFSCQGGERVGIVGATGGGKSTLAKAFFSFVDVTSGKIEIDGKDISTIPLGTLRSRMGIIAQDPVLLSGSLRLNLDIEGTYDDQSLLQALHQVQLISARDLARVGGSETSSLTVVGDDDAQPGKADSAGNANIFTNLDHEIESGGSNLSAGQKQLIVMARALLKHHKLLILDEATASIDSATDAEISRVVHEEFKGATVLIIAHRLRTIMPCTKILVMDKGSVIQQGSPLELIKEDGGHFQSLCRAAGEEEFQHLQSIAEQATLS